VAKVRKWHAIPVPQNGSLEYGGGNISQIGWMCHKHSYYRGAKMPQICICGIRAQKRGVYVEIRSRCGHNRADTGQIWRGHIYNDYYVEIYGILVIYSEFQKFIKNSEIK
jgi:hypothetical protein